MKFLALLLSFFTLNVCSKTIVILPQWHLLSSTDTQNITQSMSLPQYVNQTSIYLVLDDWVAKKKLDVIIAEGCQGEINQYFRKTFNGWNYEKLKSKVLDLNYQNITTHIPLKVEVRYRDDVLTYCGDSTELIKKHQKVISDLKGLVGFYARLIEYQLYNKQQFDAYKKALEEAQGKKEIKKPLKYLRSRISFLMGREAEILEKRNHFFVKAIQKHKDKKTFAIVIGARHLEHLKKLLKEENFEIQEIDEIMKTLPKKNPMDDLKRIFSELKKQHKENDEVLKEKRKKEKKAKKKNKKK